MTNRNRWGFTCLLMVSLLTTAAQRSEAHSPAEAMSEAATHFLASLTAAQRDKVQFEFTDAERKNWNFVPMERAGLTLKEMQDNQRHLATNLLHSALSHRGFSKALNIMALEQILFEMENNAPRRDAAKYHFYIFGEPSVSQTWGWRVEGHHLSISVTLVDGQNIVTTPTMMGTNPAHVKQGPQEGLRVLRAEEDLARELVKNLTAEQRLQAVLQADVPSDIINGPGREAQPLDPPGIAASALSPEQRKMLMAVVREYVHNFRPELAKADMKKIRQAGVDKIHFAWIGSDERGKPHYYRIQGPTFIMEYDNTQNDANHVHAVWRDFQNDFGADLLKEHYQQVPHDK